LELNAENVIQSVAHARIQQQHACRVIHPPNSNSNLHFNASKSVLRGLILITINLGALDA
jgi:hypothetical protein